MKQITFILITILYLSNLEIYSQFKLTGELRTRGELSNGYKQIPDSGKVPSFYISQRSRVNLGYKQDKYQIYISIQDVRVWGDEAYYSSTGISGDYASLDLKEAWGEFFPLKYFSIKIGRQQLKYDDERFLGARNWNQNGMSYNALLFKYNNNFKLDMGLSYNNNSENNFGEEYAYDKLKTLNFLYFNKKLIENLNASLLFISSGFQKPLKANGIYLKNTCGTYLNYKINNILVNGSGYYQFGLNKSGDDVSAYMCSANITYQLNKNTITIGTDYLSGQNFLSTDSSYLLTDHAFDILYGGRHGFFGSLDHFSNLNKSTAGGGLVDMFLKTKFRLINKVDLFSDYHFFALQNNVPDPNHQNSTDLALEKYLGSEIDLKMNYSINDIINLELGYSLLLPTESLKIIQKTKSPEKIPQWVYIMFTIKPVFLSY